jgi:hypothetical protein
MIVLGLDPSLTNFGWAIHDTEAGRQGRLIESGRFKTSSKMEFVERYVHQRESLRDLVQRVQPDRVGIEFPVFNEMWSEGMYGLFLFSCEALRTEKRDVVFWTPMQVKAWARESLDRPKGWKMGKADMVKATRYDTRETDLKLGPNLNHNEADAYLVARVSGRFWLLYEGLLEEDELTAVEQHLFTRVHTFVRGKKAGRTERTGMLHRENDRFFLWSGTFNAEEEDHQDERGHQPG